MTSASPALPLRILGTGSALPEQVVTSAELDARFNRSAGASWERSGVHERRWVRADVAAETSSGMAAAAVANALSDAGLGVGDLDALIVSAVAPEQPMPTTSVLTLAALGAPGGRCEGFDINASCVGFLTGLRAAAAGIAAGQWQRVAVVASEIASKGLDHSQVEVSALFGDGAGAVVVAAGAAPAAGTATAASDAPAAGTARAASDASAAGDTRGGSEDADSAPSALLASRIAVWPEAARACRIDAGGTRFNPMTPPPDPNAYLFAMDGAVLLRHVARQVPAFLSAVLRDAGLTSLADIDLVVPHQASGVGLRFLRERLGVAPERVVDILAEHGNQVSASVPIALDHAVRSGRLRRGQCVLLLGTGAGLSLAAAVLRY